MKFPRTIQLDISDLQVFPLAAEPGEWAVPGTFAFADSDPEQMDGKTQQAFLHGWLGTQSFGRSSLVEVAEIDERDFEQIVQRLAEHFVAQYGAPDVEAATPAARQEAEYASDLAAHPVHTLLSVEREFTDEGIAERFRRIEPSRAESHAKIWDLLPDDVDDGA
ncbi:MAG: DUF6505 family protein [Rhodovibrionaceae bacterium]|nr:DUF6505 family protein [Rhodovibrionaceae bacterium]